MESVTCHTEQRSTSHVTRHTSHVTLDASHTTHRTLQSPSASSHPPGFFIHAFLRIQPSPLQRPNEIGIYFRISRQPPLSPLTPNPHRSHVTRHTSHVTRRTSHVARHSSHVTRHTSRKSRTSHVTRHTSQDTRRKSHVPKPHSSNHVHSRAGIRHVNCKPSTIKHKPQTTNHKP